MFCIHCGKKVSDNSAKCGMCGNTDFIESINEGVNETVINDFFAEYKKSRRTANTGNDNIQKSENVSGSTIVIPEEKQQKTDINRDIPDSGYTNMEQKKKPIPVIGAVAGILVLVGIIAVLKNAGGKSDKIEEEIADTTQSASETVENTEEPSETENATEAETTAEDEASETYGSTYEGIHISTNVLISKVDAPYMKAVEKYLDEMSENENAEFSEDASYTIGNNVFDENNCTVYIEGREYTAVYHENSSTGKNTKQYQLIINDEEGSAAAGFMLAKNDENDEVMVVFGLMGEKEISVGKIDEYGGFCPLIKKESDDNSAVEESAENAEAAEE